MTNESSWAPYIRMLVYPVMYSQDPASEVDRVLKFTLEAPEDAREADKYLESVREALASDSDLSEVLPQDHSDAVIRNYLSKVEQALQKRLTK